jgi:hypothetical protein
MRGRFFDPIMFAVYFSFSGGQAQLLVSLDVAPYSQQEKAVRYAVILARRE